MIEQLWQLIQVFTFLPSIGHLRFASSCKISVAGVSDFDVKIYDIAGKLLADYEFNAENGHIDLASFGSGIYLFEIYVDGYLHVEKIIVR